MGKLTLQNADEVWQEALCVDYDIRGHHCDMYCNERRELVEESLERWRYALERI